MFLNLIFFLIFLPILHLFLIIEEVVNEVEGKVEKSIRFSSNPNSNSNTNLSLVTDVEMNLKNEVLSVHSIEQEPEWDEDRGGSVSESEYKKYVKDADIEDYLRGTYVHPNFHYIL